MQAAAGKPSCPGQGRTNDQHEYSGEDYSNCAKARQMQTFTFQQKAVSITESSVTVFLF